MEHSNSYPAYESKTERQRKKFQILLRVGIVVAVTHAAVGIAVFVIERVLYAQSEWEAPQFNLNVWVLLLLMVMSALRVASLFIFGRTIAQYSSCLVRAGFACGLVRNAALLASILMALDYSLKYSNETAEPAILRMLVGSLWSSNVAQQITDATASVMLCFVSIFYYAALANGPRLHLWIRPFILSGIPVGLVGLLTFYSSLDWQIFVRTWIVMAYLIVMSCIFVIWFWRMLKVGRPVSPYRSRVLPDL
jgi:hypothetical protein